MAQREGFSRSLLGAAQGTPLTIDAKLTGGVIRSVTLGNQSSSTVVGLYFGRNPGGIPILQVGPGAFITVPIAGADAITIVCIPQMGEQGFSGSVFIHADTHPLSASGFATSIGGAPGVFDGATWDQSYFG